MKKHKPHNHNLIGQDPVTGQWYLQLMCPECEASGRKLTTEEFWESLLRAERALASRGLSLEQVLGDEGRIALYQARDGFARLRTGVEIFGDHYGLDLRGVPDHVVRLITERCCELKKHATDCASMRAAEKELIAFVCAIPEVAVMRGRNK